MKKQSPIRSLGRNVYGWLAVCGLILAHTVAPPAAQAQQASCGFTGVKTITVQQGQKFPLPRVYFNDTSNITWTFLVFRLTGNRLFDEFPAEFLGPALGHSVVLGPGQSLSLPDDFGYTLPYWTPVGTDRVVLIVKAFRNGFGPINEIRDVARCEYDLTVTPQPSVPDECFTTAFFSDEGNGSGSCHGPLRQILCRGDFCDNLSLECCSMPRVLRHPNNDDHWSDFVSEEQPDGVMCPAGRYIQGVRCRGSFCDDISVFCESPLTPIFNSASCHWSGFFSEEQGQGGCSGSEVPIGLKCRGRFCDDINLLCCPPPQN